MTSTDCVTVTTVVAVDPERAFRVFTEEIDAWWRRGPRFRFGTGRTGVLRFEPRPGGTYLREVFDVTTGDAFDVGRVLVWEPPARLVFEYRAASFGPGLVTEVEVRFEETAGRTRVTVEHRGWDRLPPDHSARHNLRGSAFTSMIGLFWGDLLVAARSHLEPTRSDLAQP